MRTFFRFLWRNRLYSAINLVGFTVSLAFSIIIFTYAAGQFRIARSNPDHERIYAVGIDGSTLMCYGMADVLRSSLPDAASVARNHGVVGAVAGDEGGRGQSGGCVEGRVMLKLII